MTSNTTNSPEQIELQADNSRVLTFDQVCPTRQAVALADLDRALRDVASAKIDASQSPTGEET